MYDLAIIASAIPARAPLMPRAFYTWRQSIEHSDLNVAIRIQSEGFDATPIAVQELNGLDWQVHTAEPSGSHMAGYNYWLERTPAKVYLFTHPEILFPASTVITAMTQIKPNRYVAFKILWLSKDMTERLDDYDWQQPERLERCEELYILDSLTHGHFYRNGGVRDIKVWESTTTWAMDADTLAKITPFVDFGHQGADDPFQAGARQIAGIKNHTVQDPLLFHQYHPSTWDGDSELAVKEASEALSSFRKRQR